jgi:hypothetical protein
MTFIRKKIKISLSYIVKLTKYDAFGHFNSHGNPAITSTASAPPTPMHKPPRPPPFGVCESVPINNTPGKA